MRSGSFCLGPIYWDAQLQRAVAEVRVALAADADDALADPLFMVPARVARDPAQSNALLGEA